MLKPYKFIVQAVCVDVDEQGKIVGEHVTNQATLYGETLTELAEKYDEDLRQAVK